MASSSSVNIELEKELFSHIQVTYELLKKINDKYEKYSKETHLEKVHTGLSERKDIKEITNLFSLIPTIERLRLKYKEIQEKYEYLLHLPHLDETLIEHTSDDVLDSPYQSFLKKTSFRILKDDPFKSPDDVLKEVNTLWKKTSSSDLHKETHKETSSQEVSTNSALTTSTTTSTSEKWVPTFPEGYIDY
jgi:hypothetical protein